MRRDVPDRAALENPSAPDALLAFVTIMHPRLSAPIRVVSDPVDYIWAGELYTGILFGWRHLSDTDQAPSGELVVPNIDRRIGEALLTASDRAQVALTVLSSADFDLSRIPRMEWGAAEPVYTSNVFEADVYADTVAGMPASPIYAFRHFELVDVRADPIEISGRIMLRDYAQEPFPRLSAHETILPGLFR